MPTIQFKGKSIIRTHHLGVPYRQLVPHPRKSGLPAKGKPTLDGNLIIHGDNLEALKARRPSFSGRVKRITIGVRSWTRFSERATSLHSWFGKKACRTSGNRQPVRRTGGRMEIRHPGEDARND